MRTSDDQRASAADFFLLRSGTTEAPLNIDVVERSGALILTIEGELDLGTAPLLSEQLARVEASDAKTVVVDLDQVTFMDSAGLQVLFKHVVASRQNGQRLRLTRGSEQVRKLFEIYRGSGPAVVSRR